MKSLFCLAAAALLAAASSTYADSISRGVIITVGRGRTLAASMTGVTLTPHPSIIAGSAAGTVIGRVDVTLSSGAFTGPLRPSTGLDGAKLKAAGNHIKMTVVVPVGGPSFTVSPIQVGVTGSGVPHAFPIATQAPTVDAASVRPLAPDGALKAAVVLDKPSYSNTIPPTQSGATGPAVAKTLTLTAASVTSGPTNSMRVTNKSGADISRYPLQFGRPFLQGAIAHAPQVILNGVPIETQADVKNRWPDGSVKFAAIAVVLPSLAVNVPQTLTFQDNAPPNNTPLTTAQMVAMLPGDATMTINAPAELAGAPATPTKIAEWAVITNGSFCVSVDGTQRCPVISFAGVPDAPTVAARIQAALVALGSSVTVWSDYYHWTLQTNATGPGHMLSIATSPPSGTDISAALGWASPQFHQPSGSASVSLAAMLNGGFCRLRTSGQIAQTISCADDTAAASFDIGFDGAHHPFRPRFYATFWPGAGKVEVRYVGDGSKSTEIMDQLYSVTLALGRTPQYTLNLTGVSGQKKHWAATSWTKTSWLGGSPPLRVDIDPSLAYMTSTRFVPNFDPSIPLSQTNLAAFYSSFVGGHNEPYDGGWDGGTYVNAMSSVGGRQELGPYPVSDNAWLYTGMWQMRDMSERLADLAGAFPLNIRETQTGRRLSRNDIVGSSTGLGREISITDRPALSSATQYLLLYRPSGASNLTMIGPVDTNPLWTYDDAHLPAPYYVPYLLTSDPYYLDQLYYWAMFSAHSSDGQSGDYYAGRGPTGREGVINSQTRGLGWNMRSRAEAAFIAPDTDPEKAYLTYMTNDALARWEGAINITSTAYQSAPAILGSAGHGCTTDCNLWTWGHIVGNHEAAYMPSTSISPLHMWDSLCNPKTPCDAAKGSGGRGSLFTADVGSDMSPWMQNYYLYGVLRARELGFDAAPLASWLMVYNVGVVLDSGAPIMTALYRMPVSLISTLTWIQTWPDVTAHIEPHYLAGTDNTAYPGGLPGYFASQKTVGNYYLATFKGVTAMGADLNPRGPVAYRWLQTNAPQTWLQGPGGNDPRWSFIERTDTNVLPAIPPN